MVCHFWTLELLMVAFVWTQLTLISMRQMMVLTLDIRDDRRGALLFKFRPLADDFVAF